MSELRAQKSAGRMKEPQCHWAKPQEHGSAQCQRREGHPGRHRPWRRYMVKGNHAHWIEMPAWWFEYREVAGPPLPSPPAQERDLLEGGRVK